LDFIFIFTLLLQDINYKFHRSFICITDPLYTSTIT